MTLALLVQSSDDADKMGLNMIDSSRASYSFGIVLVLLVSAWIALYHLDRESIWYDEGFTAFIVHDDMDAPSGLRETGRYIVDSAINLFERARSDVHPLFYYVLMDGWTLAMGESTWVLRIPSVFFGLLALSATFALGRELFDRPTGLIASLILGISHFFIYYNREARMYTLFVAITVLLMLATVRWLRQPTLRHALMMGVLMGLLLHTHYIGIFIIATLLVYQAYYFSREHQFVGVGRWLIPHIIGFVVFLPWLPFAIEQLTGHPNGPLGQVVFPTEWGTVTWLWDIMTSSHGGLFFIGWLGGGALFLLRQRHIQHHLLLLALWFVVTPLGLLLVNETGRAVMVVRYVLVSLPPLTLLCAFGLRHISTSPSLFSRFKIQPVGLIISTFLMAWIIMTQLTTYSYYWHNKPRWKEAFEQLQAVRESDEPALIDLIPHNVATYYARHYDVMRGISIDIGWNDFVPEQLYDFIDRFESADSVWAILPSDSPKTWYAVSKLAEGRTIGYQDSVQNMLVYRFDHTDTDPITPLTLSFYDSVLGQLLSYQSGIGHHYFANVGDEFCFPMQLEALQDLDADWQLHISLTQGYQASRAQTTLDLPSLEESDRYDENICLDIPADAPRGPYLLRIALKHSSGVQQPVVESETDLLWGYFIGMAWVSVDVPSA